LQPAIQQAASLRYLSRLRCLFVVLSIIPALAIAQSIVPTSAYKKAEAEFKAHPEDEKSAWEFGRACFDLADSTSNKGEKAKIAERGADACRKALQQNTNSAAAHYYLGLNLGEIASTRGLSALKIIKEMEGEWMTAARLDSKFDYAGPERSLGMLYRDAPSFGSIGSKSKARHELMRAVELAPNYPDNYFELIDSYLKWSDGQSARLELKALEDHWAEARKQLAGPEWENQWHEWEAQLQKAKKRVGEGSRIELPRQQVERN